MFVPRVLGCEGFLTASCAYAIIASIRNVVIENDQLQRFSLQGFYSAQAKGKAEKILQCISFSYHLRLRKILA